MKKGGKPFGPRGGWGRAWGDNVQMPEAHEEQDSTVTMHKGSPRLAVVDLDYEANNWALAYLI